MEVEITMNNRLFSYVERDIQTPILTPNTMIHGIAISELEEDVSSIAVKDVKKKSQAYSKMQKPSMAKMSKTVFESATWALQPAIKGQKNELSKGEVVLIHGDQKNRERWNMKLNRRRDGVVQSARTKYGKSMLQRDIQDLYPMELSFNLVAEKEKDLETLKVNAGEYIPERTAAVAAKLQIRETTEY